MTKRKYPNDPKGFKTCTKCAVIKAANTKFYYVNNATYDRLCCICKDCDDAQRVERWNAKINHNHPVRCAMCRKVYYTVKFLKDKTKYCSRECRNNSFTFHGHSWKGRRVGANNPNAKHSLRLIMKIKTLLKEGKRNIEIANVCKVKYGCVTSIKSGKTWSHITI